MFSFSANAQETKLTWDFPVKPGSEEWKALETYQARLNAYNIPEELIGKIPTAELVKICLAYPEWGLINAFNDRLTGCSQVLKLFNGFAELFTRKDAAKELISVYAGMDPLRVNQYGTALEKGQYGSQFTRIELLAVGPLRYFQTG